MPCQLPPGHCVRDFPGLLDNNLNLLADPHRLPGMADPLPAQFREVDQAIGLAQQGGIGIIHKNLPVEGQAGEVDKVKRSESGMIVFCGRSRDPFVSTAEGYAHRLGSAGRRSRAALRELLDTEASRLLLAMDDG